MRDGMSGDVAVVVDAELDGKLRFCQMVTERIMDAGLPIWAQNN